MTASVRRGPSLLFLARGRPQEEGTEDASMDGHDGQVTTRDAVSDPQFSVKAAISREMVRLYKEQFGRGPTKARTEFAGSDIVVAVLEDSFTPAERRLVEMGQVDRIRDMRSYFQHATESQFCEVIERLLQRGVRGFTSGVDVNRDISTETFYLESVEEAGDGKP
jgi:uncharacterized protein YbcI